MRRDSDTAGQKEFLYIILKQEGVVSTTARENSSLGRNNQDHVITADDPRLKIFDEAVAGADAKVQHEELAKHLESVNDNRIAKETAPKVDAAGKKIKKEDLTTLAKENAVLAIAMNLQDDTDPNAMDVDENAEALKSPKSTRNDGGSPSPRSRATQKNPTSPKRNPAIIHDELDHLTGLLNNSLNESPLDRSFTGSDTSLKQATMEVKLLLQDDKFKTEVKSSLVEHLREKKKEQADQKIGKVAILVKQAKEGLPIEGKKPEGADAEDGTTNTTKGPLALTDQQGGASSSSSSKANDEDEDDGPLLDGACETSAQRKEWSTMFKGVLDQDTIEHVLEPGRVLANKLLRLKNLKREVKKQEAEEKGEKKGVKKKDGKRRRARAGAGAAAGEKGGKYHERFFSILHGTTKFFCDYRYYWSFYCCLFLLCCYNNFGNHIIEP